MTKLVDNDYDDYRLTTLMNYYVINLLIIKSKGRCYLLPLLSDQSQVATCHVAALSSNYCYSSNTEFHFVFC